MRYARSGLRVFGVALALAICDASCSSSSGPGAFTSHDAGADCGGRTGNPCGDGAKCVVPTDCQSNLCTSGVCVAPPPGCTDGQRDFAETDVDCGGPVCPACGAGKDCVVLADCTSDSCVADVCQPPSPNDGVKNDSETGVDCGGRWQADGQPNPSSDGAPPCVPGAMCVLPSDCIEGVCEPNATQEGHPKVDAGASRDAGRDAHVSRSGPLYCQAASAHDGVKNDSETDVDCGGQFLATGDRNPASDGAPPCAHGKSCLLGTDCQEKVCNDNHDKGGGPIDCPKGDSCVCQVPWANDGAQNDSETDVDCGGGSTLASDGAPPCGSNLHCHVAADCLSHVCTGGLCAPPSPTDGIMNDSETDIDCGGATLANGMPNPASDGAPGCADDLVCKLDTDCLSAFCSLLSHTCVDGQSCKGLVPTAQILDPTGTTDMNGDAIGTPDANGVGQHAGLDTCGVGESTDPTTSQQHESCCRSLLMPGSATLRMDKYEVTSGRIRQFLQALNYNITDWAVAQFDASWNPITPAGQMLALEVPIDQAGTTNALSLLPPSDNTGDVLNAVILTGALVVDTTGVQGCYTAVGDDGAATYWWDGPTLATMASSPPRPFTQDYYDIKPMNCIPYYLAAAFCAWDGGRVPQQPEHALVWGTATDPWGPSMLPNPYPGNQMITSDPACAGGAVTCTVDWFNGGQAAGSQGNFYFYPSFPGNVPNNLVPDSLSNGLDLSVYVSAPGRFYLDATSAVSSSFQGNESWHDLGADMIEWGAPTTLTGTATMCDQSGLLGPGESYNCNCGVGGGCPGSPPFNGVIRGVNLPNADLLGGSWEGHGIVETLIPGWSFYRQYGKTGFRCVRPAE